MASKTLVRSGASLMNRLLNPLIQLQKKNASSHHLTAPSTCPEITPLVFPSLFKVQISLRLPQNDAETLKRVPYEGFLSPCGLPSLRFFLPDGNTIGHISAGSGSIFATWFSYGMGLQQVNQCSYSPNEHINQVPSGGRGNTDSSHAKQPRVGRELLSEESQRVVQESQPSNVLVWLWPSFNEMRFITSGFFSVHGRTLLLSDGLD